VGVYVCMFLMTKRAINVLNKQLFPIMPIHRLDEKPTALGTLADLTCDSDGKIDRFITTGSEDTKSLLELHVPDRTSVCVCMCLCDSSARVALWVWREWLSLITSLF
jgi:hypothetical protein